MKEQSKTVVIKGKQFRLSTANGQANLQIVTEKKKKDRQRYQATFRSVSAN